MIEALQPGCFTARRSELKARYRPRQDQPLALRRPRTNTGKRANERPSAHSLDDERMLGQRAASSLHSQDGCSGPLRASASRESSGKMRTTTQVIGNWCIDLQGQDGAGPCPVFILLLGLRDLAGR